ncbi:hypothetical protein [Chryseobacterium carnipullorum]|uniref:hypothetical protein n=1 Tax=Chryseobacterium carnipullorum TaxID=1124835 RepID=UPI000FE20D82|nr:hypothetical protein [Chryseobacterium carnipullorum]
MMSSQKTKEILQKKSNNLTNSESKIIQLKLQQSVQNYLNQIPKKYWPHSATNPLFQILLFENNSFLQMTIFTVYCDTISGINVSYTGIDIKSSYLMAFGNPSLLMNAKNIPELDTLLSDKTFITINNPNYQGFVTEQEAIAVSKLIIRQSAQYWNLIPGNINDIGTNLDVVVISCSKGIIFKEKSTIN